MKLPKKERYVRKRQIGGWMERDLDQTYGRGSRKSRLRKRNKDKTKKGTKIGRLSALTLNRYLARLSVFASVFRIGLMRTVGILQRPIRMKATAIPHEMLEASSPVL